MLQRQKELFAQLPPEVKSFLLRSVALFIGWKLLYILVLIPKQVPDAWLVKQLGNGTASTLNVMYGTNDFFAEHTTRAKVYGRDTVMATYTMVSTSKRKVIGIYQACNGLELMILYAGFILCFTGSWTRKLLYIMAGLLGLFALNVLRSALLAWVGLEYPRHFDFAHKYLFNLVIYALTFVMWVFYVKGLPKHVPDKTSP
jgi:exosortase family protein XrtF